jgi:hypothetical protein
MELEWRRCGDISALQCTDLKLRHSNVDRLRPTSECTVRSRTTGARTSHPMRHGYWGPEPLCPSPKPRRYLFATRGDVRLIRRANSRSMSLTPMNNASLRDHKGHDGLDRRLRCNHMLRSGDRRRHVQFGAPIIGSTRSDRTVRRGGSCCSGKRPRARASRRVRPTARTGTLRQLSVSL